MKHITSRENAIYRDALRLTRKKYRDQSGLFLLEGIKPLRDAAETGAGIKRIFIDAEMYDGADKNNRWILGAVQRYSSGVHLFMGSVAWSQAYRFTGASGIHIQSFKLQYPSRG